MSMEGGEIKRCCRRPVTCPHGRIAGVPCIRSAADGCDPPAARRPPLNGALASACERWLRGLLRCSRCTVACLYPLGPRRRRRPRPICPHLGVEVAWPSRMLWPAVALLVPVSVSPPPYRRAGKVRGDGSVWLRGPCPAVRARRTTRSHSPRVLSYAHGHVRL